MADGSFKPSDDVEQSLIAAYITENGVTYVKPAYCAPVPYALTESELRERIASFVVPEPRKSRNFIFRFFVS